MSLITECVVAGFDMEVEYNFEAATIGIYSGPWDGSYPDSCEVIEILSVMCGEVDLILVLNEECLASIEEQISNNHNDVDRDYD